ncbi:MAG: hypothetical protein NT076_05550 [Candidatus Pacearchaeota archaeon]|nr:hypothetical protein [Candidatus Pacearchaeota archaeon]
MKKLKGLGKIITVSLIGITSLVSLGDCGFSKSWPPFPQLPPDIIYQKPEEVVKKNAETKYIRYYDNQFDFESNREQNNLQ